MRWRMRKFLLKLNVGTYICVNRLYYACFYAVSALLAAEGLSSSKHSGVRSLFNENFVKTGSVEKSLARVYNDLYERRQESDYVDFVEFREEQVTLWRHCDLKQNQWIAAS